MRAEHPNPTPGSGVFPLVGFIALLGEHGYVYAYQKSVKLLEPSAFAATIESHGETWKWAVFNSGNALWGYAGALIADALLFRSSFANPVRAACVGAATITMLELTPILSNKTDFADMPAGLIGAGLYAGVSYFEKIISKRFGSLKF